MSNKKSIEILARLKQVVRVKSDAGLSEALGVSPQTLSSWKVRSTIPYAICIETAVHYGISLDWLFNGHEPMRRSECIQGAKNLEELTLQENQVLTLFRELNRFNQASVFKAVQDTERLQRLTERVEALSARVETMRNRL